MASQESIKQKREMEVFLDFASKIELPLDSAPQWGDPNLKEPDILAEVAGEKVGYELTELCDQDIAKSAATRSTVVFWNTDPSGAILKKKISKTYVDSIPVELIIYWDGRVTTPDNLAIPKLKTEACKYSINPFRRIWYLGEFRVAEVHSGAA